MSIYTDAYYNMFEISSAVIIFAILSYFVGSIAISLIIAKLANLPDPRTVGSCNAGTTNMLRIGGIKIALLVLFLDILKGFLPVFIAQYIGFSFFEMSIIGLMCIIGHIFPLFFGFRGGKGVAPFIGVLAALNIYSALVFVIIWIFIAKILNISSLSAIIATFFAPLYFYFFTQNTTGIVIISIICLIILIKHKSNIVRLINKKEDSINVR